MSSRSKGNTTVREKAIPFYEGFGFAVDKVEQGGKWTKSKDLFSLIFEDHTEDYRDTGFDLVCVKPGITVFCQVTTNTPKTQKFYKKFATLYAGPTLKVHVFTHYDRDGFRVQNYLPNGTIQEIDLRKSKNEHAGRSFWWWRDGEEIEI